MTSILLRLFQLLLGVFFSTRSVALIEDIPGKMKESEGYKSSAKLVLKLRYEEIEIEVINLDKHQIMHKQAEKVF